MKPVLRFIIAITLLVFVSNYLYAQDHFGVMTAPQTGSENVLKIDADDNIYLGVWGVGIMKSLDNAASWSAQNSGLTNLYITDIDFGDNGVVFVTTFGGGVFKSVNNGSSWIEKNEGLHNLNTTAVKVLEDGRVFLGTYGSGAFYSEDGGETWIESNHGLEFRDIRTIDELTVNGFVVAGTYGGATFMTRDSGDTWKWERSGMTNYFINDFVTNETGEIFAASNGRGLLVSVNSGVSYMEYDSLMRAEFATDAFPLPDYNFTCVVINSNNEPVVGTRNHGIFKYDRFTWNHWWWTAVRSNGITDMDINSSGVIFAANINNEIYKSENDGANWQKTGDVVNDKHAHIHFKDTHSYLAIDNELYFSDDYGYNWTKRGNMPSPGSIMAFDSTGSIYLGAGNGLYRSFTDGAGFVGNGYTDTSITAITVTPDNALFVSWTFATQGDPPTVYAGLDVIANGSKTRLEDFESPLASIAADVNGGFTYIDSKGQVLRTTNQGVDWRGITGFDGMPSSIYFDHSGNVYVITDEGLFYSTNMGSTWNQIEIDIEEKTNERFIDILVTPQNRLYAIVNAKINVFGYNLIFYTDDFGESWVRADESVTQSGIITMNMNPQGDVYVYSNMLHKAFNPNTLVKPTVISPENGEYAPSLNPTIVWEPAFKAEMYHLQVSGNSNFSYIKENVILSDTTHKILDTLENNVTYHYRIRSKTHDAYSSWTIGSFKTTLQAPMLEYPVNDSLCVGKIAELSWFETDGADSYVVYVSDSLSFNNLIVNDTVQTTDYITPELNGYTEYFWKIKALSSDSESAWSQVWKFRTYLDAAELIYPNDGDINVRLDDTFRLRLDYSEEFYHYAFVEIIDADDNVIDSNIVINDSSYVSDSLNYKSTYRWRVGIVTDCNEVVYSDYYEFSTLLNPVVLLSPDNDSENLPVSLELEWESHPDLDTYRLMVATDVEFENIIIDSDEIAELSYEMDLQYNNTYYWKVMAYDDVLISDWSETWNFTTILTKPQLRVPADSSRNISLQPLMMWFSVEGAIHYQLQVAKDKNFDDLVFSQDSIFDVNKTIEILEPNTWYHWRVRAMSQSGYTEWSDVWAFMTKDLTPMLVYPANGAIEIPIEIIFRWNGDPTAEAYLLQVARDSNFNDLVFSQDDITETEFEVVLEEFNFTYYWRVRTIFDGSTSDWSEVWSFTTVLDNSVFDYIDADLMIYPNPAADFVNIELNVKQPANINIFIADMSGRIVETISKKQFLLGANQFRINVSDYSQGTYFLIIETNGMMINKEIKIIK